MVLGDSQNASQLLPVFENNKIKAYQGAQNEYPRLLLKMYWGLMKQNDRSAQETVHYWQLFPCNPEPGDVRFTNDSSQNQLFGELNRLKQHLQNLQILNLNSLPDAGQSLKIARYLLLWWMNSLSGTEETVWTISLHNTSVYCLKPQLIIVSSLLWLFFILKYR